MEREREREGGGGGGGQNTLIGGLEEIHQKRGS